MTIQSSRDGSAIGCVMITGGTGSFGSAFARFLLAETACKIRIYSRDEHKQDDMARQLNDNRVTYILGDVRDVERLTIACDGADAIVHAAALKTVPGSEKHVGEFDKTNIDGTKNVITAAWRDRVTRTLLISTDKAVLPYNTYGKTKAMAEAEITQANEYGVMRRARFATVRGGNVWGSSGSVVDVWRSTPKDEPLQVNGVDTTRFHLPMEAWTFYCWRVLNEMHGGEIFVPKLRAWRLGDVAAAFDRDWIDITTRDGDKQDEMLIAPREMPRAKDVGWSYVMEPSLELRQVWNYAPWDGAELPADFVYRSDAVERLSIAELMRLIHD